MSKHRVFHSHCWGPYSRLFTFDEKRAIYLAHTIRLYIYIYFVCFKVNLVFEFNYRDLSKVFCKKKEKIILSQ